MRHAFTAITLAAALAATPAWAQTRGDRQASQTAQRILASGDQPDVLLDVPNLSVEEITLEVDNLEAHVSLDARLANLLKLTAGADVSIDNVTLTIKGVQAQALLVVRLDNVRAIIERTLQTLDNNPQIIEQLTSTVDNAVNVTGGVVNNTVGTVGDLTGSLLRSGQLLDLAKAGLSQVSQTTNAAGNLVRRVRAGNGAPYEVVTDAANRILSSRKVN